MIQQGLNEKKIEVWNPSTVRDLQYVDDCVFNTISIIKSKKQNITINLGTGVSRNMAFVGKKIAKKLNCKLFLLNKSKPIAHKNYANIRLLKSIIKDNFLSRDFDEAIEKTIKYYK